MILIDVHPAVQTSRRGTNVASLRVEIGSRRATMAFVPRASFSSWVSLVLVCTHLHVEVCWAHPVSLECQSDAATRLQIGGYMMGRELVADTAKAAKISASAHTTEPGGDFDVDIVLPPGRNFVVRATEGDSLQARGDMTSLLNKCDNQVYGVNASTASPISLRYSVGSSSAKDATITVGFAGPNSIFPHRADAVQLAKLVVPNAHPKPAPPPSPAPAPLALVQTQCKFDVPINRSSLCQDRCVNVTFPPGPRCVRLPDAKAVGGFPVCTVPPIYPSCAARSALFFCVPDWGSSDPEDPSAPHTVAALAQAVFNSTDCSGIPVFDSMVEAHGGHCGGGLSVFHRTIELQNRCLPQPLHAEPPSLPTLVQVDLAKQVGRILREHPRDFEDSGAVERAILEYQKFLTLQRERQDLTERGALAPSAVVDIIWHAHILNTRAYVADCERELGRFVHHEPSLEPDADEQRAMAQRYARTLQSYRRAFGEPPLEVWPLAKGGDGFVPTCCCM